MGVVTSSLTRDSLLQLLPAAAMPPFHSSLESSGKSYGNIALMPLRQTSKGSARGPAPSSSQEDIVDQTINLFKGNVQHGAGALRSPWRGRLPSQCILRQA